MSAQVDTLVVGAGQAGLALSHHLTDLGHEHLLLERGRVAERWRSERWDSFRLLSPNVHNELPGRPYTGPEPYGFLDKEGAVASFEAYARSFRAPVRTGVTVRTVEQLGSNWLVRTDEGTWWADSVVVATGHYDRPHRPALALRLPPSVTQLHTSGYRNPEQLPPGGVLVVGAGPSGQQIALELARAGRRVHLAAGRHRALPRTYRGRDAYAWLHRTGMLLRTVDSLPWPEQAANAPSVVLAGGSSDLDLRVLAKAGVVLHGRLAGVDGPRLSFARDLADRLAEADANVIKFRAVVDEHVRRTGERLPDEPPPPCGPEPWVDAASDSLHLGPGRIRTIVWATGFRRDWTWLRAPVTDRRGEIVHRRGVTPTRGLYVLGLRWQWTRQSNAIGGVGDDAAHVAAVIESRRADRLEPVA